MKFIKKSAILLFATVFIFQNCAKKNNPSKTNVVLKSFKDTSVVVLPLKISNSELEKKIDQYLPTVIYKDSILEDDNYTYTIKKASKPEIGNSDNGFELSITVKLDAKGKVEIAGFSGVYPISAVLRPTIKIIPTLNADWNLDFEIEWIKHEWIEKPYVQVGFFSMDVSGMADQALAGQKTKIAKILADLLSQKIQVKPMIEQLWKNIQQPINLSNEYNFWLHLQPNNMASSTFFAAQKYLNVQIKLNANPEIDNQSKNIFADKNLPINSKLEIQNPDLQMFVKANVSHDFFENITKKQIIDKTFTISEGKKITIKDIKFMTLKDNAAISITMSGDYNGTLTIFGKPTFDTNSQEIFLKDADFEIETKNKLHKAAAWLGKGKILKSMNPFLRFSLKEHLEEIKKNIVNQPNSLNKNVYINSQIKTCTLNPFIEVLEKSYTLNYILKGEAMIELKNLDF